MSSIIISPAPGVQAAFLRGGTSKALFLHEKDIPGPGPDRDRFLIRVMGSPDPTQIDGMGGTKIVTSKIAIISPSKREDVDVNYTFCQIGLGESTISYDGNCGNISSGVGPFAINEGMITSRVFDEEGKQVVRIRNTGRDMILIAHVPIDPATNRALEKGDYAIDGCPGTGAPILMDYCKTAQPNVMLPTGNVIDELPCTFGSVGATYCEVGNPIVFVEAAKLGIQGNEPVVSLDANKGLIDRVREVRGRMAHQLGKCQDWTKVDVESPMLPMVALISKATSADGDIQSRLFLDNHTHPAMAGTGAVCTTTVSRISGSIVNTLLAPNAVSADTLRIQHPSGFIPVSVATESAPQQGKLPVFTKLGFVRTARYLFQGKLYIPADVLDIFGEHAGQATISSPNTTHKHDAQGQTQTTNSTATLPAKPKDTNVTTKFAQFTQDVTFDKLDSEAVERLRQCLLDHIGVAETGARVAESSPIFLDAIKTIAKGYPGTNSVFGSDEKFPVQYAAMLNAAFSHSLDFDDTHTGGIIHVAATVVSALLAEAKHHPNLSYQDMLLAMAIGYEVGCRIAIALGVSSWHRGFHNTSIAGIFGSVAAVARVRKLDTMTIENAFGLAGSFASGSMQFLANGAMNKRLHPAKAAHDTFLIIALAQSGTIGAAQPIEGNFGLIAAHTDTPDAQVDVSDLGSRWEFKNTGFKPYPGCRATHTCIELAALLAEKHRSKAVKQVHILKDPATYPMVDVPTPAKIHATSTIEAQFSDYYQTAVAFLYGDKLGWSVYDYISDQAVQDLCEKIVIDQKKGKTDLSTSMKIVWDDGYVEEMSLDKPRWEEPERPPTDEEIIEKFRSLADRAVGSEKASQIVSFVTGAVSQSSRVLIDLLN